ncbi:MAG TPA: hypothetical protein VFT00_00475 [Nocardioides sp.]|nr:hypothetical protein [Nocardioides sp.]
MTTPVVETPRSTADPTEPGRSAWRELAQGLPPLLLLGGLLQLATSWGAGHAELGAVLATVLLTQLVPGMLVWRALRPADGWWVEDVVLGLAIGVALAVPTQVLSLVLSAGWVRLAVPAALVLVLVGAPVTRSRILRARCHRLPWLWSVLTTVTAAVPALAAVEGFREPVRWSGWAQPYVDVPYHLALAGQVAHQWPLHYPQVATDSLYYHWFAHAWTANVSLVSGAPLDVVLLRFLPILLAVAVPFVTAAVAVRLSGRVWTGPAAAAVAFLIMDFDPWSSDPLLTPLARTVSPTQGFGLLLLLPCVALLALRWRRQVHPASVALLVPLLAVAGGSKGSVLPVLVAGCLLASAVTLLLRLPVRRVVLLDTVLTIAVMVTLVVVLFGEGSGGLELTSVRAFVEDQSEWSYGDAAGPTTVLALVVALVLALLPRTVGMLGALVAVTGRTTRTDPVPWMLLGTGLSGFAAILFLTHPGQSQWYFYRTAELPLSILAAWGVGLVLDRVGRPAVHAALGALVGVGALLVVRTWWTVLDDDRHDLAHATISILAFLALAAGGLALATRLTPGLRTAGTRRASATALLVVALTSTGLVPVAAGVSGWTLPPAKTGSEPAPGSISAGQVAGYRWLRDHSSPQDVVMTNAHCRIGSGPTCDHRRFFLAAYSERQVLVEGWAYTREAMITAGTSELPYKRVPFHDPELLALNDGFITEPTRESAAELYRRGVRWVVVEQFAPHASSLAPYAVRRLDTRPVDVYELVRPQG